jgi:hypothetical protein
MRLQSVDLGDVFPARPCHGVVRRWLQDEGRVYLELRYAGDAPEGDSEAVHWVATVKDREPVRACHSSFVMRWHLKEISPAQ